MTQIKAILTDIEGTTTDISFVHNVLFPYSLNKLPQYLEENYNKPEVAAILKEVTKISGLCEDSLAGSILKLKEWIVEDKKITPLKELQGMIWKEGYASGELKGHVYQDAVDYLRKWHKEGIKLYVYSSGSIAAQKLLFGYTEYGDLTPLFSGYFDTTIGGKRESDSYFKIASNIGLKPNEILFLSDIPEELVAAREAGFKVLLLVRGERPKGAEDFDNVSDFSEIVID